MSEAARPQPAGFGVFEFDDTTGELRKRGLRLKVQGKPIAALRLLLARPGELVTYEEMQRALWHEGTFVDFSRSLAIAINKLRTALGDTARAPRYIETLPGRGYRFIAPVRTAADMARLAGRQLLAVLPFENASGDAADDYFADGLTEDLMTQLGQIDPRRLGVIARATALRYKQSTQSLREIGRELGIAYAVQGSVRRWRKRVRITARLVQVADETQLWAERYDRQLSDVLALQDQVTRHIAEALRMELLPERHAAPTRGTPAFVAYDLYLQGRAQWNRRTHESVRAAMPFFERAIAAAPDFALAHLGLADAYAVLGYYGTLPSVTAFEQARAAVLRALALDEALGAARSSLGFVILQRDWDVERALAEHRRAVELSPDRASALHWYGLSLTQAGRFPEAFSVLEQARELDPLSVPLNAQIGRLWYFAGENQRALEKLRHVVRAEPSYAAAHYFLALAYIATGDFAAAIAAAETVLESHPQDPISLAALTHAATLAGDKPAARKSLARLEQLASSHHVPPFFRAAALLGSGRDDELCTWLERALEERFGWLMYLEFDPEWNSVRELPRFQQILQQVRAAMQRAQRAAAT
jgi:TolB-like protein/Tfp pilus assembly protein PilF